MTSSFRLLVDGERDGAWNLAVDEALVESAREAADAPPVLRLYGFRPPALSLGRSQPAFGARASAYRREQGIDLVRRPTGGGAVLHDCERTYAVVGRLHQPPFAWGVSETYERIAAALCAGLETLGVAARPVEREAATGGRTRGPDCFTSAATHEIAVSGLKLVGSAQLRRGPAFLQHGSILIRADAERAARAMGASLGPETRTDLSRALGRAPSTAEIDRALCQAFGRLFEATLEPGELGPAELARATRLRAAKYLSAAWTLEGRLPR